MRPAIPMSELKLEGCDTVVIAPPNHTNQQERGHMSLLLRAIIERAQRTQCNTVHMSQILDDVPDEILENALELLNVRYRWVTMIDSTGRRLRDRQVVINGIGREEIVALLAPHRIIVEGAAESRSVRHPATA